MRFGAPTMGCSLAVMFIYADTKNERKYSQAYINDATV